MSLAHHNTTQCKQIAPASQTGSVMFRPFSPQLMYSKHQKRFATGQKQQTTLLNIKSHKAKTRSGNKKQSSEHIGSVVTYPFSPLCIASESFFSLLCRAYGAWQKVQAVMSTVAHPKKKKNYSNRITPKGSWGGKEGDKRKRQRERGRDSVGGREGERGGKK